MAEAQPMAGVLLAAGKSRRFGAQDKLLAMLDRKPLIQYAATALAGCGVQQFYAVCDDLNGPVAALLRPLGYQILCNQADSQSASLRIGAGHAIEQGCGAVLVTLADMPFVSADVLSGMVATWQRDPMHIPLAAFDGEQMMPPVIFGEAQFGRLRALPDDMPGKSLLLRATAYSLDKAVLRDIDTMGDLGV